MIIMQFQSTFDNIILMKKNENKIEYIVFFCYKI